MWFVLDLLLVAAAVIFLTKFYKADSHSNIIRFRYIEIAFISCLALINLLIFYINIKKDKHLIDGTDKYVSSLEKLSILSEEDYTDSQIVANEANKLENKIKWLDIGSGNLHKVLLINQLLKHKGKCFESIDCLEPRNHWEHYQSLDRFKFPLIHHNKKWPEFIKKLKPDTEWSLITFIHSLYQSKLIDEWIVCDLQKIENHITHPGSVVIITEGDKSALLKIKRLIYPELGGTLISENEIIKTTKMLNWPECNRYEYSQKFYTDISGLINPYDVNSAFPWFIFESATSNCGNVSSSIVRRTNKLLISQLQKTANGKDYIEVQDVVLIFRFGAI